MPWRAALPREDDDMGCFHLAGLRGGLSRPAACQRVVDHGAACGGHRVRNLLGNLQHSIASRMSSMLPSWIPYRRDRNAR